MNWMYKIASEYGFCCGSDMFVFQLIMSKEQSSGYVPYHSARSSSQCRCCQHILCSIIFITSLDFSYYACLFYTL